MAGIGLRIGHALRSAQPFRRCDVASLRSLPLPLREPRRARKERVVADGFHLWQAQRLITAIP